MCSRYISTSSYGVWAFPTLFLFSVNCYVSEHKNIDKQASPMLTSRHPKEEAISFLTKGKTQRGEAGGLEAALQLH